LASRELEESVKGKKGGRPTPAEERKGKSRVPAGHVSTPSL